jgi:hypothetical protein
MTGVKALYSEKYTSCPVEEEETDMIIPGWVIFLLVLLFVFLMFAIGTKCFGKCLSEEEKKEYKPCCEGPSKALEQWYNKNKAEKALRDERAKVKAAEPIVITKIVKEKEVVTVEKETHHHHIIQQPIYI